MKKLISNKKIILEIVGCIFMALFCVILLLSNLQLLYAEEYTIFGEKNMFVKKALAEESTSKQNNSSDIKENSNNTNDVTKPLGAQDDQSTGQQSEQKWKDKNTIALNSTDYELKILKRNLLSGIDASMSADTNLFAPAEMNGYVDPITGKVNALETQNLKNTNPDKRLLTIEGIALESTGATDAGIWTAKKYGSDEILFSGTIGTSKQCNIPIKYNEGFKIEWSTNLAGTKAGDLVNTKPFLIRYTYDLAPKTAKAVLSNGILTFYYDYSTHEGEGKVYEVPENGNKTWEEAKDSTKKVVFNSTFKDFKPKSCKKWFSEFTNLVTVENAENLNTALSTDLSGLFEFCGNLTTVLDCTNWDTSNVEDMQYLFCMCPKLTYASFRPKWNTTKVKNMNCMFHANESITSLDLSYFNTVNVEMMEDMFYGMRSMTSINITSFNTSKVKSMNHMFYDCRAIKMIDVSSFSTVNVENMVGMFCLCPSIEELDISSFTSENLKYVTMQAEDGTWRGMFRDCNNLKRIYATDKFKMDKIDTSTFLFLNCFNLVGGNGTAYDYYVSDKTYARIDKPGQQGYYTDKNMQFKDASSLLLLDTKNDSSSDQSSIENSYVLDGTKLES